MGWLLLTPLWQGHLAELVGQHLPRLAGIASWVGPAAAVLTGAAAGWSLSPLLNVILARFFRLFNWAFRPRDQPATRGVVGLALRGSVIVLLLYGGLLVLDLVDLQATADRLHS